MQTYNKQRGFVGSGLMDLVFLLVLILIGYGLWKWLSTIVSGDFSLAVAFIWLMASGAAWWVSREQVLMLRVPLGLLLYLLLGFPLAVLSAWSGSKIAAALSAIACLIAAKYLGTWGSRRLQRRLTAAAVPGYLDQSINLIDDLARWLGACIVAWFAVGLLPLVLVFVMPPEAVPWAAMVWAFGATGYYLIKVRKSRVRLLKLPLGVWTLLPVWALLYAFQRQIAGPLEPGSVWQITYYSYWPVVAALLVEFVIVGTPRPRLPASGAETAP